MKDQTNNYIIFVLTLLFAFAACGCVDSVDTDPKNLIGRWQMSKVIHQGKTILKPDRQKWQSEVEIEFLDDGKIEGHYPTIHLQVIIKRPTTIRSPSIVGQIQKEEKMIGAIPFTITFVLSRDFHLEKMVSILSIGNCT
jgi:hypothetical protein